MADELFHAGQAIGQYRVCRLLGHGGMGTVYEAEDYAGTRVALKLFTGGLFDNRLRRQPPSLSNRKDTL